jgi:hypothetical protein
MVHRCVVNAVVMWLHILVVSLLVCVCCTVQNCNIVFKTITCTFMGRVAQSA